MRVLKARRSGVCATCRGPVYVSQQIISTTPGWWSHASCYVAVKRLLEPTGRNTP